MKVSCLLGAFAAVLLVPGVTAASLALTIPEEFVLDSGLLWSGNWVLEGDLENPAAVDVRSMLALGTFTACPTDGPNGTVPALIDTLVPGCLQGDEYASPQLRFGEGTDLLLPGTFPIEAWPSASVGVISGGAPHLVGGAHADAMAFGVSDFLRFVPTRSKASVAVVDGDDVTYYNGTGWGFVWETQRFDIHAAGIGGTMAGDLDIQVRPASSAAIARAYDPFVLLDLQEALLGPDARESRANVTGIVREFGRVPAYVNGALVGHLNGTVAGHDPDVDDVALVRFSTLSASVRQDQVEGTLDMKAAIASGKVSFGGHFRTVTGIVPIILWVAAAIVLFVRRHEPVLGRWNLGIDLATWAIGFVIVDAIMATNLGASALLKRPLEPGATFALVAFEAIALVAMAAAVWLPIRLIWRRVLASAFKWRAAGDAVVGAAWLVLLFLSPATVFSAGFLFARL